MKKLRKRGLNLLNVQEGEKILEIGFGTGATLVEIAKSVGETGKVYGIDVTPEMVELAKKRLARKGLTGKSEISEGDARKMPYEDNMFNTVFMVGVLELFDTPVIPKVLEEIKRVLKPDGRIGVISIEKEGHEDSRFIKFYEWMHRTFPKYASCRPIYVEESIRDAGFTIVKIDEIMLSKLFPIPIKFVIAKP